MPPDRSRWAALLLLLVRNSEPLVPPARPPSHAKLYAAAATVQRRPRQVNRPLLTWAEEKQLGRECQRLAGLETIRVAEAERLEREPTRCEWAKAANYTSENDMKADRLRMRACRDELISRNLRLVLSVAGRYARQPGLDFDDLVAEGNFGLAKAAARFDPEKGFRFSTYAVWWIRQAVSHAIGHDARTIRLPAHVHDKLRRMRRLREDFRAEHGRDPEHEEVAAGLGMDPSKVKRIARAAREVVSTDGSASRGGPSKGSGAAERTAPRVADLLADETQSPEVPVERMLARAALDRVLAEGLEARERDVVSERFGLNGKAPKNLAQIGEAYGLTRERIRQIERAALYKLRMPHRVRELAPHIDLPSPKRAAKVAGPPPPAARCHCRDVEKGDRLVAADAEGRACRVRAVKRGGWLVVEWEDEPGREAFARPSAFVLPQKASI